MPRVQLLSVTPKRRTWNKARLVGQKRPLLPKQVWAIRARLELAGNLRDLTLFNVAIDNKLRGCDLVSLKTSDLIWDDRVRDRVSVVQSKTNKLVQFELAEKNDCGPSIDHAECLKSPRPDCWTRLQRKGSWNCLISTLRTAGLVKSAAPPKVSLRNDKRMLRQQHG